MNPSQHPHPDMTTFEQLAKMHLMVQVSSETPIQWIYAVDDAWFHPVGWALEVAVLDKQRNPVFEAAPPLFPNLRGSLVVGTGKVALHSIPSRENNGRQRTGQGQTLTPQQQLASALQSKHPDAFTAKSLVEFIQLQHKESFDYGLCFCTFEYFQENIAAINRPQNAVFLDIRHALADARNKVGNGTQDQGNLADAWSKLLKATNLFFTSGKAFDNFEMSKLGWYLHYALKFNRIASGAPGSRCEVQDNHILIISSAINPQAGTPSGPGVMSEYTQVQTEIWEALKAASNTEGITPDRFTFSPIPKGDKLETGLAIFNNSYKDAANWEVTRTLLLEDMMLLWNKAQEGHHSHTNFSLVIDELRCYRWVGPLNANDNGLRGIHYCSKVNNINEHTEQLTAKSLFAFLRMASPMACSQMTLPTECNDWELRAFTNPCLSALIGIGDLIRELSRVEGHANRSLPSVSLEAGNDSCGPVVVVKINTAAAEAMEAIAAGNYTGRKGTTHDAMHRLVFGSVVLLHHLSRHYAGLDALNNKRNDENVTRKCHMETNCCSNIWGTHIKRDGDYICAVFYKSN